MENVSVLDKPRSIRGFLAVFDVLGFKSFCLNNSDFAAARDVLAIIDLVPESMRGFLSTMLQTPIEAAKGTLSSLVSTMTWLVFSDTIAIALPHNENDRRDPTIAFIVACAFLNKLLFLNGLPVRGAIFYGDFLLGNRCVAGKVVVEVLEQLQDLEAACTVMSNDAWVRFNDILKKSLPAKPGSMDISDAILWMLPRSSIICKSGVSTFATLNWFNFSSTGTASPEPEPEGCERFVIEMFTAHGKQLDAKALQKARNTASLFARWLSERPGNPTF